MSEAGPPPGHERDVTPHIGPPSGFHGARHSPTVDLGPAAKHMDATGARRRPVTVVAAAGHLRTSALVRSLADDPAVTVVAEANSVADAVEQVWALVPDVAVVGHDLGRDPAAVASMCHDIREELPAVTLVVAGDSGSDDLWPCVRAGAHSCLLTNQPWVPAARVVVGAVRGESLLPPSLAAHVLAEYERLDTDETLLAPAPALTPTERDVLVRLADGQSPVEVAATFQTLLHLVGDWTGSAVTKLHRTYHDHEAFTALR